MVIVSQIQVSIENRKLFSALKYALSILKYNLCNNIYIIEIQEYNNKNTNL